MSSLETLQDERDAKFKTSRDSERREKTTLGLLPHGWVVSPNVSITTCYLLFSRFDLYLHAAVPCIRITLRCLAGTPCSGRRSATNQHQIWPAGEKFGIQQNSPRKCDSHWELVTATPTDRTQAPRCLALAQKLKSLDVSWLGSNLPRQLRLQGWILSDPCWKGPDGRNMTGTIRVVSGERGGATGTGSCC